MKWSVCQSQCSCKISFTIWQLWPLCVITKSESRSKVLSLSFKEKELYLILDAVNVNDYVITSLLTFFLVKLVNSIEMGPRHTLALKVSAFFMILRIKLQKWRRADNKGNLPPNIRSLHIVKQHGTGKIERIPFNIMHKYMTLITCMLLNPHQHSYKYSHIGTTRVNFDPVYIFCQIRSKCVQHPHSCYLFVFLHNFHHIWT